MKRQNGILAGTALGLLMASAPLGAAPLSIGAGPSGLPGHGDARILLVQDCPEGQECPPGKPRGKAQREEGERRPEPAGEEAPAGKRQREEAPQPEQRQREEQPRPSREATPEPEAPRPERRNQPAEEAPAPRPRDAERQEEPQRPRPEPKAEQQPEPKAEPQAEQPREEKPRPRREQPAAEQPAQPEPKPAPEAERPAPEGKPAPEAGEEKPAPRPRDQQKPEPRPEPAQEQPQGNDAPAPKPRPEKAPEGEPKPGIPAEPGAPGRVERPAPAGEQPPAPEPRPAAPGEATPPPVEGEGPRPGPDGKRPPAPEGEAPILDSQKEKPAGEAPAEFGKPRQPGAPEPAPEPGRPPREGQATPPPPVEQGPPPADDRAAQQELKPERVAPVREEQGRRIERAPDLEQRERPRGADVLRELGDRLIIQFGDQVRVESSDRPRMTRNASDVYYEDLPGGRVRETIVRENGNQIVTIRNEYGDIIRRSRITPDGREYVLNYVDDRYYDRVQDWRDPGEDLPPLRLEIPREQYILESDYARGPDDYYRFLEQPPVERVQRLYSVDEVKRSARVRDIARRVDLDTLTFEFGSASIPESEISKLEGVATAMERMLKQNPAETFLIEGHTDAVGSDVANLALSDRRAEAVADALTNVFGIPPENLQTQGYGEQYLKVNVAGPERENRRVAIRRITPLVAPVASAN